MRNRIVPKQADVNCLCEVAFKTKRNLGYLPEKCLDFALNSKLRVRINRFLLNLH